MSQSFIFSVLSVDHSTRKSSGVTMLLHSLSDISDTKLRRSWDFTPSPSLEFKVKHFLPRDKGDIGLVFVTCSLQHFPLPAHCTISAVGSVVILAFVLSSLVRNIEPIVGADTSMLSRTPICGKQERMCLLNIMCVQKEWFRGSLVEGADSKFLLFLIFFNLIYISPSMCLCNILGFVYKVW